MIDYRQIKKLLDKKFKEGLKDVPCDAVSDFWSVALGNREEIISKFRIKDAKANQIKYKIFTQILTRNCKVLDAGCGDGTQLEWLVRNFPELDLRLFGFDLSEVLVKRSRERLRSYPSLSFTNNSIDSIPYRDSFFDVIICFSVLQYPSLDPIKALSEMERVLKGGGFLVIYKPKSRWLDPFLIPDLIFVIRRIINANRHKYNDEKRIFDSRNGREVEQIINTSLQKSNLKILFRKPVLSSFKYNFYKKICSQLVPILAKISVLLNKLPLGYYKDSEIIVLNKHRIAYSFDSLIDRPKEYYIPYLYRMLPVEFILDIGCGLGQFLELCERYNIEAIGIDNSTIAIDEWKKRKVKAIFGNLEQGLPFKNEEFDAVFCNQVIEHLHFHKQNLLLKECYRVLTRGGKAFFYSPCKYNKEVRDKTHIACITPSVLRKKLENLDFAKIDLSLNYPRHIRGVPFILLQLLFMLAKSHKLPLRLGYSKVLDFFSASAHAIAYK